MVSACGDEPVEVPAGGSAAPITKEDRFSGDEGLAAFRQAADAACTPIRQSLSPTPPSGDASAIRPWAAAQRRGLTQLGKTLDVLAFKRPQSAEGLARLRAVVDRAADTLAGAEGTGRLPADRYAADLAAMRDAAFSAGLPSCAI